MSKLLLLYKYQLRVFLSNWCDLKDVAFLDTAHCNHTDRHALLEVLANEIPFLQEYPCLDNSLHIVWLWTRRIHLRSLHICESGVSLGSLLFKNEIQVLRITDCVNQLSVKKIDSLLSSCTQLRELVMDNVDCSHIHIKLHPFFPKSAVTNTLKQLIKLHLGSREHLFHLPNLAMLSSACSCLEDVVLYCSESREKISHLTVLITNNRNIKQLTFLVGGKAHELFAMIGNLLPNVELLHLLDVVDIVYGQVQSVIDKCKSLRDLKVSVKKTVPYTFQTSDAGFFALNDKNVVLYHDNNDWWPLIVTLKLIVSLKLVHNERFAESDITLILKAIVDNNCHTLTSVHIAEGSQSQDATEYALKTCENLKHVSICYPVTCDYLFNSFSGLTHKIVHLQLGSYSLDNVTVDDIAKYLKLNSSTITKLSYSNCLFSNYNIECLKQLCPKVNFVEA